MVIVGMKRKSNDEFVADLRAVNPNVIALEAYQNSRTKILFRCLKCGHEWSTIPDTLMMGHGCPKCGRKLANYKTRKTNNDFLTELATILPSVIPCDLYKVAAM